MTDQSSRMPPWRVRVMVEADLIMYYDLVEDTVDIEATVDEVTAYIVNLMDEHERELAAARKWGEQR